jgi:predicted dehydrogenase
MTARRDDRAARRRLGFGVVGLGAYGDAYLACLRDLQSATDVEIAAVASRSADRAEAIASRYGAGRSYTSAAELVRDPNVDVVCVVTAEDDHAAPVLAALEAGKEVIVEKPIALRLDEADAMIGAARRLGRHLMVGHQLRSAPPYIEVATQLKSGALGDLISMNTRRNRPREAMAGYRRTHPFLETGIHDVDVMLWVARSRVRTVRAWSRTVFAAETPDAVWGVLEFESGVVGHLETIWLNPASGGAYADDALTVLGSRGVAKLDLTRGPVTLWNRDGYVIPDLFYEPRDPDGAVGGALRDHLLYFIRCLRDRTPPNRVPVEDVRHGLAVVLAMIRSADEGREVEVACIETPERVRDLGD